MMDSLIISIQLVSLIGFAATISTQLGLAFVFGTLVASSLIITILYASSLVGLLSYAHLTVTLIGLYLSLMAVSTATSRSMRSCLTHPTVIILLIGSVTLFFATRGLTLVVWDEFSHWGAITKAIVATSKLPTTPGSLFFLGYPPGDALFQYFVTRFASGAEGNWVFAHSLLMLTAGIGVFSMARRENWVLVLLASALVLIAGYFIVESRIVWTGLLVDVQLTFFLAASVSFYFSAPKTNRLYIALSPILVAMVLIKDVGFYYSLAVAAIIFADLLAVAIARRSFQNQPWLVALACVVAAPYVAKASWAWHVSHLSVLPVYNLSWQAISGRITHPGFPDTAITVIGKYGQLLAGHIPFGNGGIGLPAWIGAISLVALAAIYLCRNGLMRARISLLYALLASIFLANLGAIAFHHLFAFSHYEAKLLAGLSRYAGAPLLAWLFVLLGVLVTFRMSRVQRAIAALGLFALVGGLGYRVGDTVRDALLLGPRGDQFSHAILPTRREVSNRVKGADGAMPRAARVYIVWNATQGLDFYMSAFELRPRITNSECFSLGHARNKGDLWSCPYPYEELRNLLKKYDYLFLGKADDVFWTQYGNLFAPGSEASGSRFFKIIDGAERYILRPVE